MSRLAIPNAVGPTAKGATQAGDGYVDRVAKYVPGEVLAAYVAIQNILTNPDACNGTVPLFWWVVFALFLGATPGYIYKLSEGGTKPWKVHATVSTVAFVVWSYALTACPKFSVFYDAHDEKTGAALLVLFTLFAGLIEPRK